MPMTMNLFMYMFSLQSMKARLLLFMKNGALISLEFGTVSGRQPIPDHKHLDISNFLKVYHNHIVTKWLQFYVYKQKVQNEKITKKVKI
jgi:hypothetical protein